MNKTFRLITIGAVLLSQSGCYTGAREPVVSMGQPYVVSGSTTEQESRPHGAMEAALSTTNDALDITLQQPMECRDPRSYARDRTSTRKASTSSQIVNVGGFALFGTAGAVLLASTCTAGPDASASNPNPPSHACSGEQRAPITGAATLSLVAAGLFGAAFVGNALTARDGKETIPMPAAEWQACASKPLANSPATLKFADGQTLSGTTDNAGHVSFQVASIRWTDDVLRPGTAKINVGDKTMSVSLASLPAYAAWKERSQALAQQVEQQCEPICRKDAQDYCMQVTRGTMEGCGTLEPYRHCMSECKPKLMARVQAQPVVPTANVEETLNGLEADIATAAPLVSLLERTKAPWPAPVIAQAKALGGLFGKMATTTQTLSTVAIPKALEPRALDIAAKGTQLMNRANALAPKIEKTRAFYQARKDAEAAAILQAMFSGSGGGSFSGSTSSPTSATDDRLREMEDRHQRERADDERKRQQDRADDERRRKEEEERRHREEVRDCVNRCQAQCYHDLIRKDCENIAPCQQQCPK